MQHVSHYLKNYQFKPNRPADLREIKDGDWYWINKGILSHYFKQLNVSGVAIYNILAYFANSKTQACFPSHKTIGKMAGLSKSTVVRKIKELEKLDLIVRENQKRRTVYYLLKVNKVSKNEITGIQGDTPAGITSGPE